MGYSLNDFIKMAGSGMSEDEIRQQTGMKPRSTVQPQPVQQPASSNPQAVTPENIAAALRSGVSEDELRQQLGLSQPQTSTPARKNADSLLTPAAAQRREEARTRNEAKRVAADAGFRMLYGQNAPEIAKGAAERMETRQAADERLGQARLDAGAAQTEYIRAENEFNQARQMGDDAAAKAAWDRMQAARQTMEDAQKAQRESQAAADEAAKTYEWEGRAELVKQLKQLEDSADYVTDPEQANALEARMREVRERIDRGDMIAGNGLRAATDVQRARSVVKSSAGQYASGMVNAAGTGMAALHAGVDTNEYAGWATDPVSAAQIGYEHDESKMGDYEDLRKGAEALETVADRMGGKAAQELERAKNGLSGLGKVGVDIATNMLQMGFDAAIGKLGVGALTPMFIRSMGASAQEARQAGASVDQQLVYGVAKGAVEVLTEKIGGVGSRWAYGKGWTDALTDQLVYKLARSELGANAIRILSAMISEGGEEVLSDLLDPLARVLSGMDPEKYDWGEIAYDFLIGAGCGGVGAAGTAVGGGFAAENAEARARQAMDADPNVRWAREEASRAMDVLSGKTTPREARARYGDTVHPDNPILAAVEQAKKSEASQGPQEAAGAKEAEGDKSVLPSTQKSTEQPQEKLNSQPAATEAGKPQNPILAGVEAAKGASSKELVEKIQRSIPSMKERAPVTSVSGAEIPKHGRASDRMLAFIDKLGRKVTRPGFGDVLFSRNKIKASLFHGLSDAKVETFAAVPAVIERGEIVDRQKDRKGRGYDSLVIAAPVDYKGQRTYLGVVIDYDAQSNRYYVHEVVDENGEVLYKTEAPLEHQDRPASQKSTLDTVHPSGASEATVTQLPNEVKTEKSEPAASTAPGANPASALSPENHGEFYEDDAIPEDKPSDRSYWNSRRDSTPSEEQFADEARRDEEQQTAEDNAMTAKDAYLKDAARDWDEHHEEWEYEARRKNGELSEQERKAARIRAAEKRGKELDAHIEQQAGKVGEILDAWAGEQAGDNTDEYGNKHKAELPENLHAALDAYVAGTGTAQELADAYKALESGGRAANGAFYYEDAMQEALEEMAAAEKALESDDSEAAQKRFRKAAQDSFDHMAARMRRLHEFRKLAEELHNQSFMNEVALGASGMRGVVQNLGKLITRLVGRPDVFFRAMGGFDKANSTAWYRLADLVVQGELDKVNIRQEALDFFGTLTETKGYKEFETGKTTSRVKIPWRYGKPEALSMNYALGLLRTLETKGAVEHIARNGARFAVESDYYKGINNNGFGDADNMAREIDTRELAKPFLPTDHDASAEEWIEAKEKGLRALADSLKAEVMADPIASAAYHASVKSMAALADHLNRVSYEVDGIKKAMGGETYWPLEVCGKNEQKQTSRGKVWQLENARFMHRRNGPNGALRIRAFTDTTNRYIEQASRYAAWIEMTDMLQVMNKHRGNGEYTTRTMVERIGGKQAATYLENWEKTINGEREGEVFVPRMRSNLANAALNLNPGVALKQTPSFFDYAGELSPKALWKVMLMGPQTTKRLQNNPMLQALGKNTKLLKSREAGFGMIEVGDSMYNSRGMVGKVTQLLPKWISKMDYKTVAKGALAAMEQVKMDNPDIDVNSEEFFQKAAQLFELATVRSQPIYDAEFRAEGMRSGSEFVRALHMFRTQQTQNLNQLVTAIGEYRTARANVEHASADALEEAKKQEAQAKTKLAHTVSGQILGHVAFSALNMATKALMHRTKGWRDKDTGEIDPWKVLRDWGFGTIESAAGTLWLCDNVASFLIDNAYNLAGSKDKPERYHDLSDNVVSTIADAGKALMNLTEALGNADKTGWQKAKAVTSAIGKLGTAVGLPLDNAFKLANTAVMWSADVADKNPDHYDNFMTMMADYSRQSEKTRATRTSEAALASYAKGDTAAADKLLSTLDWESAKIVSAFKSTVKDAVVSGELSDKQAEKLLDEYTSIKPDDIAKFLANAGRDRAYEEAKAEDPSTFGAAEEAVAASEDKVRTDEDRQKVYDVVDILLNAAKTPAQADVMVDKYTSESYRDDYHALRDVGASPDKAAQVLEQMDANNSATADKNELYEFYLAMPQWEGYVGAVFNSRGYTNNGEPQSWKQFLAGKKNREYDEMALEHNKSDSFSAFEQQMKELASASTSVFRNGGKDAEIMQVVLKQKFSADETDTVMKRYLSKGGYGIYEKARAQGLAPTDAAKLCSSLDANGNGSVTKDELIAYYEANPESEAVIAAIWDSRGYKEDWKHRK